LPVLLFEYSPLVGLLFFASARFHWLNLIRLHGSSDLTTSSLRFRGSYLDTSDAKDLAIFIAMGRV
jgi:hypothetical protein